VSFIVSLSPFGLVQGESIHRLKMVVRKADQIQRMQKVMLELWQTSLEFAVTTWRTRGRLRSTPDKVNEWFKMGPITEDTMRGMFEHVYRARKEPTPGKRHIVDHGFTVESESAQRPRGQIPAKGRKLTESTEVLKARKARKLQEKAEAKEEKRLASEKKKQARENTKKAKAAATAAKARERKRRRSKPPLAKREREEGQGNQDPGGPRTKQARTGAENERDQTTNSVHRKTRNSNKDREESQGVTISNNTVVSNINRGICAKGDG
jgi:hypothetical protein